MQRQIDVSALVKPSLLYKIVGAVLLLNMFDSVSTIIGLQVGLTESNPFSDFSVPFLAFKFGVWLTMLPLIYLFDKKKSAFGLFVIALISIIGLCAYIFVVTVNFALILGGVV